MLPQTISPQQLAERVGPGLIVLDVDGTLAPLRIDRHAVRLSQAVQKALARLALRRPVALVSGRPLAFLQSIAGDLPLLLVGSHGAEANRAGLRPAGLRKAPVAIRNIVRQAARQGVTIEEKPYGMVLHFRKLPSNEREAAQNRWGAHLGPRLPAGWDMMRGNAVVEIRPHGVNKGSVVTKLRHNTQNPIGAVLGDDITDEDMFAALQADEVGVLVGERRDSRASLHLRGVTAVRQFIEALARV